MAIHYSNQRVVAFFASAFLFVVALTFSGQASADCACFCVNGEMQTLCSSIEEAQGQPTMCSPAQSQACPIESSSPESAAYDAPADGATNCRDIRVYDARRGAFTTVKACDVLDAS